MYKVLNKNIIENEILPHLSTARRRFKTKSCLCEIINCILYKLKTGIQWHMLPVSSLFSDVVLSYKSVYGHFRKWCKSGERESSWLNILKKHKSSLDLSTLSIDGSHTKSLRGGEEVDFQTRKMCKTTNALYLTDNQGLPIAMSSPVAGSHHDLYQIDYRLDELFVTLKQANIATDGLFINADAGFDSKEFRNKCIEYGIIANTAINPRNGIYYSMKNFMSIDIPCFSQNRLFCEGVALSSWMNCSHIYTLYEDRGRSFLKRQE